MAGWSLFKQKTDIKKIKEFITQKYDLNMIEMYGDGIPLDYIKNVDDLFFSIPPLMQYHALLMTHFHFSEKDYNKLLRTIWTENNYPNIQSNSVIVSLFRIANPGLLMTKKEQKMFNKLPDNVTIYRGVETKKHKKRSLSWTPDIDVAKVFANRHTALLIEEDRKIIQASIKKKYVFAYFINKVMIKEFDETEVVVNPDYLKDIRTIESIKN